MDKNYVSTLINKITSYTKHYAVVNIEGQTEGVTRFANSEISQNINKQDLNVYLTLHDGKKEATGVTNVLDDDALKKLVHNTESLLQVTPAGDFAKFDWEIPDLADFADKKSAKSAKNSENLAEIYDVKGRAEVIKEGVSSLGSDFSAAGAITLTNTIVAYGNSDSKTDILFANLDNVTFNTVVTNIAANSDGGGEAVSHKANGLDKAIQAAFKQAKDRSVLAANPITLTDKRFAVVLSPAALGDLVFYITWSLNGKRVIDGLSFCGTKLPKEQIFGKNVSIYDDVSNPKLFPLYFDYEGNKRQSLPLIEKGVVKNLLLDNKTAQKLNMHPTGHAHSNQGYGGYSSNTVMQGGDNLQPPTQADIIKGVTKGLFISEFHYSNFVNPATMLVTGLTRNGTFLIEDGEITKSVANMRFTQNIIDAFNNISALSKDLQLTNSIGAALMPSAKIEGFCFP
ncbi:MAG: TldD/PmbA family protein [Firmicutes bacterium]|nr:TldD/PmbA family protein [Bacillota bacterium]